MKVIILCGGKGTRLREETEFRPKPMVEIGGKPIIWHIMHTYAHHGFTDFVLCLGYRGDVIRDYFLNFAKQNCNCSINLRGGQVRFFDQDQVPDWQVTLVDTGQETLTGGRVKRVEPYVDGQRFLLTYGDGVTDLDIGKVVEFHQRHGRIGTVTGVTPPSRYGELFIQGDQVVSFKEKPQVGNGSINGGYFVFERAFFDYLDDREDCVLEKQPLERLAEDGQLCVYPHRGFWQCMDTFRDYTFLNKLWADGQAPWKV